MKPLKLILEGFETYCKKTTIDFSAFGSNGLYLITGKTGAGKTTIFDGICFALYGESSGSDRSDKSLRSTNADAETQTYADFTFEDGGKIYRVKRNPEYMRKAKKGDGFVKQAADAELTLPDGTVISQLKNVNPKIYEILSLDKNQFEQIAMIAQGKFQRLLFSDTADRIELFRKIFKTERYEILQRRLKDEVLSISRKCDEANLVIEQFIKGIACDEESPFIIDVRHAFNKELPVSEICSLISSILKEDKNSDAKIKAELNQISQELENVNAQIEKLRGAKKIRDEFEAQTKALEQKNLLLKELDESLLKEKENLTQVPELDAKAAVLKEKLSSYDELEEFNSAYSKESTALSELKNKSENLKQNILTLKNQIRELKKEKESLLSASEEIQKLDIQKISFDAELKTVVDILNDSLKLQKEQSRLEQELSLYKKNSSLYEAANSEYLHKEKLFLDEQAGLLALGLKENEPCPVCGSVTHPNPAHAAENAPSEAELNKAKTDVQKAKKICEEQSALCAQIRGSAETLKERIEKIYAEVFAEEKEQADLSYIMQAAINKKDKLASSINEIKLRITELKKLDSRKTELEKLIPAKEKELEDSGETLNRLTESIIQKTSFLESTQTQIQKIKSSLEFESKADAEKNIFALESQSRAIQDSYNKVKDAHEKNLSEIAEFTGKIKTLKEQLSSDESLNEEKLLSEYETLANRKNTLLEKSNIVFARISKNSDSLEKIQHHSKNLETLEEEYAWKSALDKTANGGLGGKEKIKLETYIQMTFFDRIIRRSNLRLFKMTGGQYELIRANSSTDKRQQSGLELDVKDYYNGGQRSVKTLSGGEQFQASLSLALGLSDEIQAASGGIQLDSMFIDEGFGSLDPETLDKAMKSLSGLAEGNKIIGIISHVNDLKQTIDRQIVVEKNEDASSSTVRIVC